MCENEEAYEALVEQYLNDIDENDEKHILVDYEIEKPEVRFRWEYQHESLTCEDSVFRKINPYN